MDLPLPITLCEPMTEVQRRAEILLTAVGCLDQAAAAGPRSLDRLLHIAAFVIGTYSVTARTTKCLPPLLGETYEFEAGGGLRFLVEMTVADKKHGDVATAWTVDGGEAGWTLTGDDAPRASLRAGGLEFEPGWREQVVFGDGDAYEWGRVSWWWRVAWRAQLATRAPPSHLVPPPTLQATPTVVGLISGNNAVSYSGRVRIAPAPPAATTALEAVLAFEAPGVLAALKGGTAVPHAVTGWVECARGGRVEGVELVGDWTAALAVTLTAGGPVRDLWRVAPPPPPPAPFGFGGMAAALNDPSLVVGGFSCLPPTDSRRRPDLVALEAGDWVGAQAHLDRLQAAEAARAKRGRRAAAWFERLPDDEAPRGGDGGDAVRGPLRWRSTGEYWGCRERGDWGRCASIV